MESQLSQDKNPAITPEEQEITPVDRQNKGPATSEKTMELKPEPFSLTPQSIRLANGQTAQWVYPPLDTNAEAVVAALGLEKPESLLLITGDPTPLTESIKAHLTQLFSRSLARTAAETNTIIIDEGRLTDLTSITGQGVADRGYTSRLLGVTQANKVIYPGQPDGTGPQDRVALEAHHAHFVLVADQEKRSESEFMTQIAAALAGSNPVVTVVAQGGEVAKDQVVQSVRQGWPILVIRSSGGLADEIAGLWQQRPRPFIADPALSEIISDGNLYFFELTDSTDGFSHLLKWLMKPHQASDYSTLELVWNRFGVYDEAAKRQQRHFRQVQNWILILGVLGTSLALIRYAFQTNFVTEGVFDYYYYAGWVLFVVLLLIPITVSLLIAAANRSNAGSKWIALRATAESIKKEIYLYRAHAESYSPAETTTTSREVKLARRLDILSSKLMQSEANVLASKPYTGVIPPQYSVAEGDDGFSFLTPDRYITYRLQEQLDWYYRKTIRLERQLQRLQWLILLFGALGTLLVAIRLELWIALTTSLVAALTTYLEYQQVENTLIRYNQTATDLANILSWWISLSPVEKADPKNINKLVGQTETLIHAEHGAWVKEQQDAMAALRAEQAEQEHGQQAGQAQQVTQSFTQLANFFEGTPVSSPQTQQVKEGVESLATLVESKTISPTQAVQMLNQVTTRTELLEASTVRPVEDEQTQDSLTLLSSLVDDQRLSSPQLQQTLSSLTHLAQLVQSGQLSGEQVNLSEAEINQVVASLTVLSTLLEKQKAAPAA